MNVDADRRGGCPGIGSWLAGLCVGKAARHSAQEAEEVASFPDGSINCSPSLIR